MTERRQERPGMLLRVPDRHVTAFCAYLALGTLEAVFRRAIPPGAAAAPLDSPRFWQPIEGKIDPRVLAVLQSVGDVDLPEETSQEWIEGVVASLQTQLLEVLSETERPTWSGRWIVAPEGAEETVEEGRIRRRLEAGIKIPERTVSDPDDTGGDAEDV